jgi:MFS family permease
MNGSVTMTTETSAARSPAVAETTGSRRRLFRGTGRDIWLLSGGVMVSTAGDAAAMIALLLRLRPDGAGWVSALLGAQLVPSVIAAHWFGRIIDSHDKRRLLILALSGQAAVGVPLALIGTPWVTVALFFAMSTLNALVRPATSAMIPSLAGEAEALTGYAWVATGTGIGWILGPAAGGLLTGSIGARATLLGDAGTFLVLTLACAGLSFREKPTADAVTNESGSGGAALIWRDVVLRTSILVSGLAVGCAVVDNVAAPYRFVNQLGTSSFGYGGYLALWGLGALVGAQLARRAKNAAAALAVGNLLSGVGIAGIGLAPVLAGAYVASVVGGVGNGLATVSLSALVSSRISAAHRGRAFAATMGFVQASTGLGTASGAPLVTAFGAGHSMAGAGGLAAIAAFGAVVWAVRLTTPAILHESTPAHP